MIQLKCAPTDWISRRFGLAILPWTSPVMSGFAIFDDAERGFFARVFTASIALAAYQV